MANTATAATRRRPRKPTTNGEPVTDTNDAKPEGRSKALYHIYEEAEDGALRKLGDDPDQKYEGRNANEAVEAYIADGHNAEGVTFVVVPDRNLARVKAEVETKTKVKLSAV
jgi:hypothetical protein